MEGEGTDSVVEGADARMWQERKEQLQRNAIAEDGLGACA